MWNIVKQKPNNQNLEEYFKSLSSLFTIVCLLFIEANVQYSSEEGTQIYTLGIEHRLPKIQKYIVSHPSIYLKTLHPSLYF